MSVAGVPVRAGRCCRHCEPSGRVWRSSQASLLPAAMPALRPQVGPAMPCPHLLMQGVRAVRVPCAGGMRDVY